MDGILPFGVWMTTSDKWWGMRCLQTRGSGGSIGNDFNNLISFYWIKIKTLFTGVKIFAFFSYFDKQLRTVY